MPFFIYLSLPPSFSLSRSLSFSFSFFSLCLCLYLSLFLSLSISLSLSLYLTLSLSFLQSDILIYPLSTSCLLTAGSLADIVGRKVIFVGTAALITLGSIGSACSFESSYMTVYGHIACWRFLLGMYLSVCLSACSSVYVPVYLHVSSSVYVSACLSYYLALHLFICTILRVNVLVSVLHVFALHLSVYMHLCQSVCLSLRLYAYLCAALSVYTVLWIFDYFHLVSCLHASVISCECLVASILILLSLIEISCSRINSF